MLMRVLRRGARLAARGAGIRFLNKSQTVSYLKPYALAHQPPQQVALPAVTDATDDSRVLFEARTISILPGHVWQLPAHPAAALLRNGALRVGKTVLWTDYHTNELMRHGLRATRKQTVAADILVAPFSHYQHPTQIWGYYDFMLLVATKLCRLLAALPAGALPQVVVSYPLFGTSYERELFAALGLRPEQVVDSRTHQVRFGQCLVGDSGDWYYPSLDDVQRLRTQLAPLIQTSSQAPNRLYISRAGRRRITNEDELVRMLLGYGFTVAADAPRTLAEQLTLYHHAAFIMGPHGASFANTVWSQPGTQLFEIFSPGYAPDYFLYLARMRGLRYAAAVQPAAAGPASSQLEENMTVRVGELERALHKLLQSTDSLNFNK